MAGAQKLDLLELVFDLEKFFHIKLKGNPAAKVQTVGEMAEWVCSRLGSLSTEPPICPSISAFYGLRDRLHQAIPGCETEILPETPMTALVGRGPGRLPWPKLTARTGLCLPVARDTSGASLLFIFLYAVNAVLLPLQFPRIFPVWSSVPLGLIVAGLETCILLLLLRPLIPRRMPVYFRTVSDVVCFLALGLDRPSPLRDRAWSRSQVRLITRLKIAGLAGRPVREIRLRTRLAEFAWL